MATMSSTAFPSVALMSPAMVSLKWQQSSSVAYPRSAARGTIARNEPEQDQCYHRRSASFELMHSQMKMARDSSGLAALSAAATGINASRTLSTE
jgi:hypothetical protein